MVNQIARYALTELEAFNVMRAFLEAYWQRGLRESDDLAVLLGQLMLLPDGMTADPAHWDDWLAAIRAVKEQ
jgi:hypothetical protein